MESSTGKIIKPRYFIVDVDGVLTDGTFDYTVEGKISKRFGPNDADALNLLKSYIQIQLISGDKRGFMITKKRADDMKLSVELVSTFERLEWIKERFNLEEVIFMADGIFDAQIFDKIAYSIAPTNAFYTTKKSADFVTSSRGGDSAVAEACLHILEKFFTPFDPLNFVLKNNDGVWGKGKI